MSFFKDLQQGVHFRRGVESVTKCSSRLNASDIAASSFSVAKKAAKCTQKTDPLDFFGLNDKKRMDLTKKKKQTKCHTTHTKITAGNLLRHDSTDLKKDGKNKDANHHGSDQKDDGSGHISSSCTSDEDSEDVVDGEDESDHEMSLFQKSCTSSKDQRSTLSPEDKLNELENKREEMGLFRRQMKIRVSGSVVPDPMQQFEDMDSVDGVFLDKKMQKCLLRNIEASEYKEPTPIQMQAIPIMLQRRDILAIAPTGSGKTAAFAIPMLATLASSSTAAAATAAAAALSTCLKKKQEPKEPLMSNSTNSTVDDAILNVHVLPKASVLGIVLAPTRELAVQIHAEFTRLASGYPSMKISLLSKANAAAIVDQTFFASSLKYSHHQLIISTPLRLVHLLQENKMDLSTVQCICLDEADQLFDMGFVEQIDEILAACTKKDIQRVMFSATMLEGVEDLAKSVLRDPIKVCIGRKNSGAQTITQRLLFVGREEGKLTAMKDLIQEGLRPPVLVFVQNKDRAQQLYSELAYENIHVGVIHTDRSKEQRDDVMKQFRRGDVWVLICTDLMSRGMDFRGINMVINYDFPQSAVSYIHRIGRTGRAGKTGEAITFFTEYDMNYLRSIANVMKLSGCEVPEWMLSLKKVTHQEKKQLLKAPPRRRKISTVSGYDLKKIHKKRMMRQTKQQKSNERKEE